MARSEWIAWALSWVLTYLLHSTALLALAWLAARTLARGSLGWREALWKSALVGGLLTATLQVGADLEPLAGRWSVRAPSAEVDEPAAVARIELERRAPAAERERAQLAAPPPAAPATREPRAARAPAAPLLDDQPDRRLELTAGAAEPPARADAFEPEVEVPTAAVEDAPEPARAAPALLTADPRVAAPSAPEPATTPIASSDGPQLAALLARLWPDLLLGLWLAGGLGGLALLAWAWTRLADLVAGREELREGALFEQLQTLCARAGLRRAPRLSTSARLASPATVGVLRPQICVPRRALTELAPEHREAMLAHELAHVARRDPQWSFLARAIERALFFQPLNRVARRELADIAEYRADDWAVRQTGQGVCLARCLAEVAAWVIERRPAVGVLPMAQRGSQLGRRIRRLLEEEPRESARGRWLTPLAPCAIAAVTLVLPGAAAGERARAAQHRAPREEPAPSRALERLEVDAARAARAEAAAEVERMIELLDAEIAELVAEVDALAGSIESRQLETSFAGALAGITAQVVSLRDKKERLERLLPAVLELAEAHGLESERPGTGTRPSSRGAREVSPSLEER